MATLNKCVYLIIPVAIFLALTLKQRHSSKSIIQKNLNTSYDYVIVGAGSAGCVIASRLSEDPDVSVLLLEAGDDDLKYPDIAIPLSNALLGRTDANWNYFTEPQDHAFLSSNDRKCYQPRGKCLGGSSSINAMVYVRGNREDYDRWAREGNTGWSYADVLPYFIRSERNTNPELQKSGYHGSTGPLTVSDTIASESARVFLEAGKELGYDILDVNGASQIGFGFGQSTVDRGRRWSAADAYLRPAMGRSNLHVATLAHVNKVLIDRNYRAIGVQYERDGSLHNVKASREVILSAGAFGSAQILMLSGIGPKFHLDKHKIPLVADLPVGENLEDHVMVTGVEFTVNSSIAYSSKYLEENRWIANLQYLFGKGVIGSSTVEANAFVRTKRQNESDPVPYIQISPLPFLRGNSEESVQAFLRNENIKLSTFKKTHKTEEARDKLGVSLIPQMLHSRSRGTVRLRSTNPRDPPLIDPNYLSHPQDADIFVDGIRICQKIAATKAFARYGIKVFSKEEHPVCKKHPYDSDEFWNCYVRHNTITVYHPVSTCRMGPNTEKNAVVDPDLRVRGVRGLRVADASVMPHIVSGNTNAPTIMIGEKASDLIKDTYRRS